METISQEIWSVFPFWSESNLISFLWTSSDAVVKDGAFLSQVILAIFSNFMVPEMFENDRAWNLTGSDKSAFIPIESNSFGKWIAKDTSIISIKELKIRCGIYFYSQACC